ncbi:MAG: hypothetical protein HMLKMBBP_02517 [Planctomycetes bacterium]|nr:hypothetical protein [Planctomycetota bacterium]
MGFVTDRSGSGWPGGVVPYRIDEDVPQATEVRVLEAMRAWSAVSPARFVPRRDERRFLRVRADGSVREDVEGTSDVGRTCRRTDVRLAADASLAGVVHELGHALGLRHEHQRPDRDAFVVVRPDRAPVGIRSALHVLGERAVGPYDALSVMHYGYFGSEPLRLPAPVRSASVSVRNDGRTLLLLLEDGTLESRAWSDHALGDPFRRDTLPAHWTHVFRFDAADHVTELRVSASDGRWESLRRPDVLAEPNARASGDLGSGPYRDVIPLATPGGPPRLVLLRRGAGIAEIRAFDVAGAGAARPRQGPLLVPVAADTEALLCAEITGSIGSDLQGTLRSVRLAGGRAVVEIRDFAGARSAAIEFPAGFTDVNCRPLGFVAAHPETGEFRLSRDADGDAPVPPQGEIVRLPRGFRLVRTNADSLFLAAAVARGAAELRAYSAGTAVADGSAAPVILPRVPSPALPSLGSSLPTPGDAAAVERTCQGDLHVCVVRPGSTGTRRATILAAPAPRDVSAWRRDDARRMQIVATAPGRAGSWITLDEQARETVARSTFTCPEYDGAGLVRRGAADLFVLVRRNGVSTALLPGTAAGPQGVGSLLARTTGGLGAHTHVCGFADGAFGEPGAAGPGRVLLVDRRSGRWSARAFTGPSSGPGPGTSDGGADPGETEVAGWFGATLAEGRFTRGERDNLVGACVYAVPESGPGGVPVFVALSRRDAAPEIRPWTATGDLGEPLVMSGRSALPRGARVAVLPVGHGRAWKGDRLFALDPADGNVTERPLARDGTPGVPLAPAVDRNPADPADPTDPSAPGGPAADTPRAPADADGALWLGDDCTSLAVTSGPDRGARGRETFAIAVRG